MTKFDTIYEFVELSPPERTRRYYFALKSGSEVLYSVEFNEVCKVAYAENGDHLLECIGGEKFVVNHKFVYMEIDSDNWPFEVS